MGPLKTNIEGETKRMQKLRFGLIGCGGQGKYLGEALAITGLGHVVACADPEMQRAQALREWLGAEAAFASGAEMLKQMPLEACIVATRHDQLQPCVLEAVQAGKHVLVEKPMALKVRDALALVHAAKEAGVKLMIGYTLRFMPERLLMRQLLLQGAIGDPVHINAGQIIGKLSGWLNERAYGGGPLFYVGCHILDNVLWLAQRPVRRVYAALEGLSATSVEASADIILEFEGGFNAFVSTSQRMGGRYGWLDIMGTAGRMRVEWESPELYIESQNLPEYRQPTRLVVAPEGFLPPLDSQARGSLVAFKYLRIWAAELYEFCSAILQDRNPPILPEEGVNVLRVIEAVYESAQQGQPVSLDYSRF